MKEFWNSRTIYRKVVIVAMALQFIGWFLIPFAEMYKGAAAIKNALKGLGTEVLPDKFTMFSLGKFMMDMDSSDWIFYWSVIIINAVLLVVIVMGQKRASYVISYICWHVVALFAGIGMMAGGEVYGYEGKPLCTLLIYAITAVVFVGCLLGAIFEYKAQAKLAARLAEGYVPAGGPSLGNIDTEKLKAQAGNIADTGAAVAKKTAKMAVKGFYKASEAAKDFVESAKNESGAAPAPQPKPAPAPQPKPAPAPQPKPAPAPQPIPAPAPQPKPAPAPQPIPAPAPKPQTTFADDPDKTIMLPQTGIPQTGNITGIRGMFAGAQIPIGHGESVIIGRAADSCHIILTGQAISRKHCVVQYDGTTGNYLVTDYSANGTFLGNGSKLPQEKSVTLTPGSVIWIGNNENTFQLG